MAKRTQWMGVVLGLLAATAAFGQVTRPVGVVTSIDAAGKQIIIRTDGGPELVVLVDDQTSFLRLAPCDKDLAKAAKILLSDVAAGDRVLARGTIPAGQTAVAASSILVMARSDIARKQMADRAEWERRGIGGIVKAVNCESREITISIPGFEGARTVMVTLADGAVLRRYAPDSVKFSDARPSSLDEIKADDQIRARGSKSEDGTRLAAEELVSGSFVNITARVDSVDPQSGSLRVTDLSTKQRLDVRINPDSNLRRMPPVAAGMTANRGAGGGGFSGGPPMQRPRDLQAVLERIPTIKITDLKAGETVAIASTRGADPLRLTAITILADVDRLLNTGSAGGRNRGTDSWSLNLNMNMDLP